MNTKYDRGRTPLTGGTGPASSGPPAPSAPGRPCRTVMTKPGTPGSNVLAGVRLVEFTLNGREVSAEVPDGSSLLDLLRAASGLAAAGRRGEPMAGREVDTSGKVGTRAPRYRGDELALGDKPYINDMQVPEMLHGAVRFSDHPRARVVRIDTSKAESHPGV